tara:strand:+ start:2043 stop:2702 length:660 start_codon:yes stop_codon:yes gene_type:complete
MKVLEIKQTDPQEPIIATSIGTVKDCNQDRFRVVNDSGFEEEVTVALSCVIRPEKGDVVALFSPPHRLGFITTVLERESDKPLDIYTARSIRIESEQAIRVSSQEETDLSSAGDLKISANQVFLSSPMMRFIADEVGVVVRMAKVIGDQINGNFRTVTTTLESLFQNARNVFRTTKDLENVQCGTMTTKVEGFSVTHCKDGVILAENDMRVDGERVHVG